MSPNFEEIEAFALDDPQGHHLWVVDPQNHVLAPAISDSGV